jgi:hypothetical protein
MNKPGMRFIAVVAIVVFVYNKGIGQTPIPEILSAGTITEQMKYIEEKTIIYENYRAIREDMFQKIKNNSVDSLIKYKSKIREFVVQTASLNNEIDSLKIKLDSAREEIVKLSDTKNSISVLGIEINKTSYNSAMWTIVAVLIVMLSLGFLIFKRDHRVTVDTKKELKALMIEFEAYRQKTRIEREKVSMDHFNEIRKLKGK